MRNEVLSLAVMERPPGLVDNKTFGYFLLGFKIFHGSDQKFAPELDLGVFRPYMEEVYQTVKLGKVYTEREKRNLYHQYGEELIAGGDWIENSQEAVERGRMVYLDAQELDIRATSVKTGEFDQVAIRSGLSSLIKAGHVPMLEMHTHPTNHMFSEQDYIPLITEYFQDGRPVMNATLVLCPDFQFLALRTHQTPVLHVNDALALVKESEKLDLYDEYPLAAQLLLRFRRSLEAASSTKGKAKLAAYNSRMYGQIIEIMKLEGKSDEEIMAVVDESDAEFEASLKRRNGAFKVYLDKTKKEYLDYHEKILNGKSFEFPRSLNIELYVSEDATNFYTM